MRQKTARTTRRRSVSPIQDSELIARRTTVPHQRRPSVPLTIALIERIRASAAGAKALQAHRPGQ
jgi:hypothetical protein